MTPEEKPAVRIARRRFITIAAAAAGAGLLPRLSTARDIPTFTWRGVALGAEATLTLQHSDEAETKAAIEACLAEVARLEAIFSLHRPESALARLNRDGRLEDAPWDLRILLSKAIAIAAQSGGAFDPTVQPLWALYARHFSSDSAAAECPSRREIEKTLTRVGWKKLAIDDAEIRLGEDGMAITLNGIAQGYITDKVGDLLRWRGFKHVLVNMGEQLALGPKQDGSAWQIGIQDPVERDRIVERITLEGGAVATSGGYGCSFDGAGRLSHILDPRTGAPSSLVASVTVVAPNATHADALSTALTLVPISDWRSLLGTSARAYFIENGAHTGRWV